MRIGVLPIFGGPGQEIGGIYQYSARMLDALDTWKSQGCADELVVFAAKHCNLDWLNADHWTIKPVQPPSGSLASRLFARAFKRPTTPHREARPDDTDWRIVRRRPEMARWFRECGIDLMLYPFPTPLSFEAGIPYVMAIHDLQHRLQPEFPEVSADGEWQRREYLFHHGSKNATLLLADSQVGKEDILTYYGDCGVGDDQVRVLPFLPAHYLSVDTTGQACEAVRRKHELPDRFMFYPATWWPHKNQKLVIEALGILAETEGLRIPVVFCGTHAGELRTRMFEEAQALASRRGIDGQIKYLGYVPDEDMGPLYAAATALVMPTFFGPTNIPPLEAWAFGCPVVTSDIRGLREQTGDAGILVDPRSPTDLADALRSLWTDEARRAQIIELGRERLSRYTPLEYHERLMAIIEDAKQRLRP